MNCPQCRVEIEEDATSCECGWIKSKQPKDKRRCSSILYGHRCQMVGSMTTSTRGENLLCKYHYRCEVYNINPNDYSVFKRWHERLTVTEGVKPPLPVDEYWKKLTGNG